MSAKNPTEVVPDQHKPKNLIRSQYKDVMVKVDEDIYYLDRLQLALKSGYFEKLFIEDYRDRNSDLIEIPLMDTDTFSAVVDVIYGKQLKYVQNSDNFISLLMAMDYLQMDIDPQTYECFVQAELCRRRKISFKKDVFKLYYFIADDAKYEYLLPVVFEHLSRHLEKLQDHDELLSIKTDHILRIISKSKTCISSSKICSFRAVSKVCARWISHDMKNRLHHALSLVNAARSRFFISNNILHEDFNLRSSFNFKNMDQNEISRWFYRWLMYCGEISCPEPNFSETEEGENLQRYQCGSSFDWLEEPEYSISDEPKLELFLKNSNLYDITIKVDEKMYKLHRLVLKSESLYFEELFSREFSELSAQCEGIPSLPSKDQIYSIDEIDSAAFDIMIDHIYLGTVELTCDVIVGVYKAVHILKIDSLKTPCDKWIMSNAKDICAKDVVEILNFTPALQHCEYVGLSRLLLSKYMVDSWPKIDILPHSAHLFKAITPPEGAKSTTDLDQETFKLIIDYICFGKSEFAAENLARLLKASSIFKMEKLLETCVEYLIQCVDFISSSDVREVLSFTLENVENHETLITLYLVQHMKQWPQVDIELFCSISYDCLENMLLSYYLYFDDPRDLLDICSKWVTHDVENRYLLIPQIALAISQNRIADCDDYSIENPSDFKECTQDFIKNEIRKILSPTSALPFPLVPHNETKKQKIDRPTFIASHQGRSFEILNADWERIVSFQLGENIPEMEPGLMTTTRYPMSAAVINENLFILCSMHQLSFFYVYNLHSKKLFSLASDPRIFKMEGGKKCSKPLKYTLLNCCREIHCCLENGEVLKYLFEFNRWMRVSAAEPDKHGITFASDGNKLYRMYEVARNDDTTSYIVEIRNVQHNAWVSSPDLPGLTYDHEAYDDSDKHGIMHALVFLNNHGLAALFEGHVFICDLETPSWQDIRSLPVEYAFVFNTRRIINQNENDETLYVCNDKLFQYSTANGSWIFKKQWPSLESEELVFREFTPYGNIMGIHNPKIYGV